MWDFGSLRQEKPEHLAHSFKLENLSAETVSIKEVLPDCGCMVVDNPPSEIRPGSAA